MTCLCAEDHLNYYAACMMRAYLGQREVYDGNRRKMDYTDDCAEEQEANEV